MKPDAKKILFVCVENAGRSQMAEALANKLGLSAMSAGALSATAVSLVVVAVMKERKLTFRPTAQRRLLCRW